MPKLSLSKLETFLKSQCDALRSSMDAAEYKDYLIAMIFLKRVNDLFVEEQEHFRKELKHEYPNLTEQEISDEIELDSYKDKYEFFVPPLARWKMDKLPLQFEQEQRKIIEQSEKILANSAQDPNTIQKAQSDKDIAEKNLSFRGILYEREDIGNSINIALHELERSNGAILQGVLTGKEGNSTNFNETNANGEKKLKDETLLDMIQDFNKYSLTENNFEFPDLMGAAYEFLIKYFAESAGKKGGEFYTPHHVVELMGKILKPAKNAMICDPTVGSGGLLINMKNYVEMAYGSAKDLLLFGQESKESPYKMCRMNMIFHGIKSAKIHLCDTLLGPTLVKNGELIKYDIVVANPPFSQNYTTKDMKFKDRFHFWMSKKKQADFMFVQHMISTLKADGRMAVIMPHGVLFRSGEEQKMRKWLITGIEGESTLSENANSSCILEAVIGLPSGLFYGTPIAASILVINKKGASDRKGVLFINADRDYKEGKNQNILRPEDIDKISYVYTQKDVSDPKYSRFVTQEELEAEDFNCNIRRWVDNVPEPDNQDVEAHLNGGLPKMEVDALDNRLNIYNNLKTKLFAPLKDGYYKFSNNVPTKEAIKEVIVSSEGYKNIKESYHTRVDNIWTKSLENIKNLPKQHSIQNFNEQITTAFLEGMKQESTQVLNLYQLRGAIAHFFTDLKYDFMSVVASGWNAELIPEEELLESQFPEILKELKENESRRDEIQAQFDAVNEMEKEEDWDPNEFDLENAYVIPKSVIKNIKADIKKDNSEINGIKKQIKLLEKRISAYKKSKENDDIIQIEQLEKEINGKKAAMAHYQNLMDELSAKIKTHTDLEEELKECRRTIKTITKQKDQLVEQAREKITPEESQKLIIARWNHLLHSIIDAYLEDFARNIQLDIEHIYDKYTVTLKDILADRDKATMDLNKYLEELGYVTTK